MEGRRLDWGKEWSEEIIGEKAEKGAMGKGKTVLGIRGYKGGKEKWQNGHHRMVKRAPPGWIFIFPPKHTPLCCDSDARVTTRHERDELSWRG